MAGAGAQKIVIVGGGFSGAAVAYHLAQSKQLLDVTVIEPRASLGAGLAYDTRDPAHRINVPSSKMSLLPDEADHFDKWIISSGALANDPDARAKDGNLYPRRSVFGAYVDSHLAPLIENGRIKHVVARAANIECWNAGWRIHLASGGLIDADLVVIATSHPAPEVPAGIMSGLGGSRHLITDATTPDALNRVETDAHVLIVGTGLTMADVVASLDHRGHRGQITAISRRGLLSRPHAATAAEPYGSFRDRTFTALGLLKHIRSTVADAEKSGIPWQAVFDAVRAQAQSFWPLMHISEQKKLVRHLRPFWDVHRFRIAPQADEVLRRRAAAGTFKVVAGRIVDANVREDGALVSYKRRTGGGIITRKFDTVVITTGPDHSHILAEPQFRNLGSSGLISQDPLHLGIACDRSGRAISADGRSQPNLFIAGPLARATFGELMGLPQVAEYSRQIANEILARSSDQTHHISQPQERGAA